MDGSSRYEMSEEALDLNFMLEQEDVTEMYRASHPKAVESMFSSSTRGTASREDHMLGHKTTLNTFEKIEVLSSIFSSHNGIKLEINYERKLEN